MERTSYQPKEKPRFTRFVGRSISDGLPLTVIGASALFLTPPIVGIPIALLTTVGEIRTGARVWKEEFGNKATKTEPNTPRKVLVA
jgi:hypothetical protein